jgi:hypothetical protein
VKPIAERDVQCRGSTNYQTRTPASRVEALTDLFSSPTPTWAGPNKWLLMYVSCALLLIILNYGEL